MAMPTVDTGRVQLSYERSGSGAPLLLIMGMSGTLLSWGEPFLDALRESFEVITYDHRGVGDSTPVKESFTILDLAQDAAGLLSALNLDSAHVMGISMGGMVAQELALGYPERIRTLVLGCTYCGGEGSSLASEAVMGKLREGMASGDRERAIRGAWEVNVSERFAADSEAYGRFLELGLRRAVSVQVILEQIRAISGHDTSARLGGLAMPTMVIHGTADQMLPVANGRMIAELVSGSRLEILEQVGHLFFWERPGDSAELVRAHASVYV
jgi:pimeloyl-ACP methyl ester carboxylesterase